MSTPEYVFCKTLGPALKLCSPDGLTIKELALNDDGTLALSGETINVGWPPTIEVSFTGGAGLPYVDRAGESYAVMAYLHFSGTNTLGTPTSMRVLSSCSNANKDYDIRIVRADTGAVIAELTGQNNIVIESKDMGALSNLPTDDAVLEIQGKVVWNAQVRLAALSIKF
jgi:hypothetical protein